MYKAMLVNKDNIIFLGHKVGFYVVLGDDFQVDVFENKEAFDLKYEIVNERDIEVVSSKWTYVKAKHRKIDLSKLPKNTFINDTKEGGFYKHDTGIWCEVSAHCVDCEVTVFEKDHTGERRFENPVVTPAEEYFLDFTVIAIPPVFDLKDAQC